MTPIEILRRPARKNNPAPKVAIPWVLVQDGGTTQVDLRAGSKLSKTGPMPGADEGLVHIPPGQGALDVGSQVEATTWPVIKISKAMSFTPDEEAKLTVEELRLTQVNCKGDVKVQEKDFAKGSLAHVKEPLEEDVVVEGAPMVEDTACVKKESIDKEGAEEASIVKVAEEVKVECVEEGKRVEGAK